MQKMDLFTNQVMSIVQIQKLVDSVGLATVSQLPPK